MMTIKELTKKWSEDLKEADINTHRLDVLVLIGDALNRDRSWILANPEFELDKAIYDLISLNIEKRKLHIPLAYIRGKSEFYGREFKVSPATLQPRPETETMIELLVEIINDRNSNNPSPLCVVDVGTGSGCIAITANLEIPNASVHATDINNNALKIAEHNSKTLKANVNFHLGNLLEPLHDIDLEVSVVLANLPYVPDDYVINKAAMQEPKIAIFGGSDGLDLYKELFSQLNNPNNKPKFVLTESLPTQHYALLLIAKQANYSLIKVKDLIQVFSYL